MVVTVAACDYAEPAAAWLVDTKIVSVLESGAFGAVAEFAAVVFESIAAGAPEREPGVVAIVAEFAAALIDTVFAAIEVAADA